MVAKALMTPDSGELTNLPAYAQAEEGANNLQGDMGGASFPRLTFKGNRFRVKVGEEETVLDETRLPVILLDAYPKVSRIYFRGSYDVDGADSRPLCASADGEVPLPTVAHPQNDVCATCPMNQKGSSVGDDGGKRRACSFFKRVAFLLPDYPEFGPVVSDLKSMSLFGDSYADKGYLNLRAYADMLAKHRTKPHAVVTELTFDTNSSVPKVLFRATSYVPEKQYFEDIEPLLSSGQVEALVDCTEIRTEGSDDDAPPAGGGFRDKLLENKPAHAATEDDDEEETPPPPVKGQKKKKVTKKKAAAKKPPAEEEETEEEEEKPKAKKAKAEKPKAKKAEAPADHPKFCGDCGAPWGTCEHTGNTKQEPEEAEDVDDDDDEDATEFDKDLAAALAEYEDED